MRRLLLSAIFSFSQLWLLSPSAALAASGDLDPSFGTQGVALSPIGDEGALAMTLEAGGKILTATIADAGTDRSTLRITRFSTTGMVDAGFGTGGVVSISVGTNTLSMVRTMLRQAADNKVVLGGRSVDQFAVSRLTTAGALDVTFGTSGTANTVIAGDDEVLAIAQQADAKLVAVGSADDGLDSDFALVRYTAAGQLDAGFSGDGIATVEFGGDDTARAVAIQSDGFVVVAGDSVSTVPKIAIARLSSTGILDPTFGTGGKVVTAISTGESVAHAVTIQPDGRIVVAGEVEGDFVLVRYTSTGQLDSQFGAGGIARTNVSPEAIDYARALVRQTDGKLVAAGVANPSGGGDFALVRYTSTGQLDPSFGTAGVKTTSVAVPFDEDLFALALQGDGKLVACGLSEDGSTTYQMLARYLGATATAVCGNAVVEPPEQCDDGNTVSGDGCDSTCSVLAECGDADQSGKILASDAQRVLKSAVGQPITCPVFVCDVDSNGAIVASDALKVLKKAVGQNVVLTCPPLA